MVILLTDQGANHGRDIGSVVYTNRKWRRKDLSCGFMFSETSPLGIVFEANFFQHRGGKVFRPRSIFQTFSPPGPLLCFWLPTCLHYGLKMAQENTIYCVVRALEMLVLARVQRRNKKLLVCLKNKTSGRMHGNAPKMACMAFERQNQ